MFDSLSIFLFVSSLCFFVLFLFFLFLTINSFILYYKALAGKKDYKSVKCLINRFPESSSSGLPYIVTAVGSLRLHQRCTHWPNVCCIYYIVIDLIIVLVSMGPSKSHMQFYIIMVKTIIFNIISMW